jgi:putative membrane protein
VTLRQSYFQRRAGLISLTATTSAGAQRYVVPDLPDTIALDLAERLVPQSGTIRVAVAHDAGRQHTA